MSEILYLYGIVPAASGSRRTPPGIDDRPVEQIESGGHSALLTRLDGAAYAPQKIEQLAGDIDWVRGRAEAHDRVLNWASDAAQVVPLPMWTLFRDADAVRKMLSERKQEFDSAFARIIGAREYTVRAYVRSPALKSRLAEHSGEFRELEERARAASPGQRYLLERKLEEQRKEAARAVVRRVAGELHDALVAGSDSAVREEVAAGAAASERGHAILNASYLIRSDRLPEFQRALTSFVERYEPSGFTFEFTGPWPPYHFVGGSRRPEADTN